MKIVFQESALQDIQWYRYYYQSVFPEGRQNAGARLKAVQNVLAANPYAGHPSEVNSDVRELSIPRTPFTFIYRVKADCIEILRLWDNRQGGSY